MQILHVKKNDYTPNVHFFRFDPVVCEQAGRQVTASSLLQISHRYYEIFIVSAFQLFGCEKINNCTACQLFLSVMRSGIQRGHPAFRNLKAFHFFLFMFDIFAFLDPNPKSCSLISIISVISVRLQCLTFLPMIYKTVIRITFVLGEK
jgi:hypothetical protein